VQKLLLLHVLEQLKREGCTLLNLGFSPLWDLRAGLSQGLWPAWWCLLGGAWMYEHCNGLYGFRALAAGRWGPGVHACVPLGQPRHAADSLELSAAARRRTQFGGGLAPGDRFRNAGVGLEHVWLVHSWTHPVPGLLDLSLLFQYVGFFPSSLPALFLSLMGLGRLAGGLRRAGGEGGGSAAAGQQVADAAGSSV
jgi:hypothetical protein